MKYLQKIGILFGSVLQSSIIFAPYPASAQGMQEHINNIVSHLVGVMDRSAQVAENPNEVNVRMTTCRVDVEGTNEIFLYQEQALTQRLNEPYRQRFLRLIPSSNGQSIESQGFEPINPKTWVGLCDRVVSQQQISSSAIGEAVCTVSIYRANHIYIGVTPPKGCPANVRGAVSITNTVILHEEGMDTWDRGLDEQGNRVWGAENEPYEFRWLR